jgi:hypothetical protein
MPKTETKNRGQIADIMGHSNPLQMPGKGTVRSDKTQGVATV